MLHRVWAFASLCFVSSSMSPSTPTPTRRETFAFKSANLKYRLSYSTWVKALEILQHRTSVLETKIGFSLYLHITYKFTFPYPYTAQKCGIRSRGQGVRASFFSVSPTINAMYRCADKSLARPDLKKTIERSPFFVRRGGHCCRGDLVGRTAF